MCDIQKMNNELLFRKKNIKGILSKHANTSDKVILQIQEKIHRFCEQVIDTYKDDKFHTQELENASDFWRTMYTGDELIKQTQTLMVRAKFQYFWSNKKIEYKVITNSDQTKECTMVFNLCESFLKYLLYCINNYCELFRQKKEKQKSMKESDDDEDKTEKLPKKQLMPIDINMISNCFLWKR